MSEGSSLVRFMNERGEQDDRGKYFWSRASIDGAPFRGHSPPMLRDEEYENRVVRVGDPKVRIFNINDADERREYQGILAKVVNGGWGQVLHVDRQFDSEQRVWLVYLEWVEWFMEDGSPDAAQAQRTEPTNGQQQVKMPPPGLLPGQTGQP